MNYTIDPAKATINKYKNDDGAGINEMNNTCYAICSAFQNTQSPWTISKECANNCRNFVNNLKSNIHDTKNLCAWKAPYVPPEFNQVPKYFPSLFKETNNPEQARNMCIEKCNSSSHLPNECKEWCNLLADSVVSYEQNNDVPAVNNIVEPTIEPKKEKNNTCCCIIILLLCFLVILYFCNKKYKSS